MATQHIITILKRQKLLQFKARRKIKRAALCTLDTVFFISEDSESIILKIQYWRQTFCAMLNFNYFLSNQYNQC